MILEWLNKLNYELGNYDQTTHGVIFTEPLTIEKVMVSIAKAYRDPCAYNTSTASQTIEQYLKEIHSAQILSQGNSDIC